MSNFVSIAIDGPAGAGKSTMARACAQALGYLYVDTGAIYRTVGYYMRLMGVGPKDKDGIARLIDEVNIDIRYEDGVQHMILNGADVTGEIRTPEMSMYASGVSAQPCVRAFLLDMQRQLARPRCARSAALTSCSRRATKRPTRRSSLRRSSATNRIPSAPSRR